MPASDDHASWLQDRTRAVTSATGNLSLVETRWTGDLPDIEAARASAAAHRAGDAAHAHAPRHRRARARPAVLGRRRPGDPRLRPHRRLPLRPGVGRLRRVHPRLGRTHGAVRAHPRQRRHARAGRPRRHPRDDRGPGRTRWRRSTTAAPSCSSSATRPTASRRTAPGASCSCETDAAASPDGPIPVTLDFNRAFVPPCGFSAQYNCPLPPASNRFAFPVARGREERRVPRRLRHLLGLSRGIPHTTAPPASPHLEHAHEKTLHRR